MFLYFDCFKTFLFDKYIVKNVGLINKITPNLNMELFLQVAKLENFHIFFILIYFKIILIQIQFNKLSHKNQENFNTIIKHFSNNFIKINFGITHNK